MSLSILKRNAQTVTEYIRFDDLGVGKYYVKEFALCDNLYGSGKRVMVHLKNGYVILPQRMSKDINTSKAIEKLNKEKYVLVFNGKDEDPPHRVNIDFELLPKPKRSVVFAKPAQLEKKRKMVTPDKKSTVTNQVKKVTTSGLKKKPTPATKRQLARQFFDDEAVEEDDDGNAANTQGDDNGPNEYDLTDEFIDDSPLDDDDDDEDGAETDAETDAEMDVFQESQVIDIGLDGDSGEQIEDNEEPSVADSARRIFSKKKAQPMKKTPAKK